MTGRDEEITLGGTPRVSQPHRYFALESEEMIRRGELREAIEHCRRGLIFYPDNISGYAVLANASLLLDDNDRAVNVLLDGHRRTGAAELKELAEALASPTVTEEPARETAEDVATEEPTPAESTSDEASVAEDERDAFLVDELHITDIVPGINDDDETRHIWSITDDERPQGVAGDEEIVADDASLFEEEVEPVTRDLFTGEPLDDGPLSFRVEAYDESYDADDARENQDEERGEDPDDDPPVSRAAKLFGVEAEGAESTGENRESGGIEELIPAAVTPLSVEEIVDAVEDVEEEEKAGASEEPGNPLSLHSGTPISKLRSRNLRLIPGLEYAPLRKDDTSPKFAPLLEDREDAGAIPMPSLKARTPEPREAPPTPPAAEPREEERKRSVEAISSDQGGMTPLEELARRLESARIPAVEEPEEVAEDAPAFEPSLVSDTFAAILLSQGAYAEAVKAYQMLARLKPERREEYEKKIAEVKWSMGNVTDA